MTVSTRAPDGPRGRLATRLTVVKLVDPEGEHSPESRYLFGMLLAEIGAAFEDVRLIRVDPSGDWPSANDDFEGGAVLLLGPQNVLFLRDSLRAMGNALGSTCEIVVPFELARTDLPSRFDLFTLRDFERAEQAFLGEAPEADEAKTFLPVSLTTGSLFADMIDRCAPGELATEAIPAGTELARVGLCHRFVDYYGQPREDVLRFLHEGDRDVLEIGCGRGATGALIRERLGARVTGVELNPEVARAAAEVLDEVVQGDIEELDLEGRFDVVVAFELFEHLVDGESFLEKARSWLRPGGRIVLSVPNVGHYSIVEDLLEGRWDYLPIGLLCYTHYRFFTRHTLERWLRRCGFEDFEIVAQKTELPERFEALPESLPCDPESLSTSGFFVVARLPG